MSTVKRMPAFDAWLFGIKVASVQRRLLTRLRKAALGNLGDVHGVGAGVSETREHFGPGWRMDYVQRGQLLIVMLAGDDKRGQRADIAAAKRLAATLED